MTGDFPHVRETFAESVIGRTLASVTNAARSAWRTSVAANGARAIAVRLEHMPKPALIATIAVTIAIASVVQLPLRLLMPLTVVPLLPWPLYLLIAIFAAGISWQAEAIVTAWQSSSVARWWGAILTSLPRPPNRE
jgi:hypothetical protein